MIHLVSGRHVSSLKLGLYQLFRVVDVTSLHELRKSFIYPRSLKFLRYRDFSYLCQKNRTYVAQN